MISALSVFPTITKFPVDRHNFGWSGVPSRPRASTGIHDYPSGGAHECTPLDAFARILGSVRLNSLPQVDNLKTLQEIVIELEGGNIP